MNKESNERNARAFEYMYNAELRRARRTKRIMVALVVPLVASILFIIYSVFNAGGLPR
jgi:ABC-type Na+ efflux pump permease subunit